MAADVRRARTGGIVPSASRRWRGRLRFVLAAAASLALHLLLKQGLERTTLAVRPPGDAVRALSPSFRPRMAVDFPLEPDRERREAPAHERPLDMALAPSANAAADRARAEREPVAATIVADEAERPDIAIDRALGLPTSSPEAAAPVPVEGVARDVPEPDAAESTVILLPEQARQPTAADGPLALARRRRDPSAGARVIDLPGVVGESVETAATGASTGATVSLPPRPPERGDRAGAPGTPGTLERSGIPAIVPDSRDGASAAVDAFPAGPMAESSSAPVPTAGGVSPLTAPLARRSRRARDGALASDARGGAMSEPEPDGERPSVVEATGTSAAGPRQARRAPASVPGPAPTGLPRATVASLPTETRVRETAEAFARRTRTLREPTPADAVVERGLAWLARGQAADGRWTLGRYAADGAGGAVRLKSDTAATGLALLAFLGAGYDHFDGPHRDTIRRGLEWLVSVQKEDGDLFVPADPVTNACAWLYSHGIATTALCEAVGMTGDPLLRPAAEKAIRFAVAAQQSGRGGWRYQPRADSDLSVSGWMLVALRSGALAGLDVPGEAFEGVVTLLDASAIPGRAGSYAYNTLDPRQRPSERSANCMTALGTLMRLHTDTPVSDPSVMAAAAALASARPAWSPRDRAARDAYLWYYSSQVLVHTGGTEWDAWYGGLTALLAERQVTSGPDAGSWDPLGSVPDRWGAYGGRLYVTALHLLALEVPYRHLPTYGVSAARPE